MPGLPLSLALLALLVVSAEVSSESVPTISVSELGALDIDREVADAISAARPWFFATAGFSRDVPGVGVLNYRLCFGNSADLRQVIGSSDYAESEDDFVVQQQAFRTASEFNRRIADHLQAGGLSSCSGDVDWDHKFGEVSRDFASAGLGQVALNTESVLPTLVVLTASTNHESDARSLCRMAGARGLPMMRVRFLLTPSTNQLSSRVWTCGEFTSGGSADPSSSESKSTRP
ncbi:MAG: hypothetical protein ACRDHN_15550 [Thermomicrobiales bacterium]